MGSEHELIVAAVSELYADFDGKMGAFRELEYAVPSGLLPRDVIEASGLSSARLSAAVTAWRVEFDLRVGNRWIFEEEFRILEPTFKRWIAETGYERTPLSLNVVKIAKINREMMILYVAKEFERCSACEVHRFIERDYFDVLGVFRDKWGGRMTCNIRAKLKFGGELDGGIVFTATETRPPVKVSLYNLFGKSLFHHFKIDKPKEVNYSIVDREFSLERYVAIMSSALKYFI